MVRFMTQFLVLDNSKSIPIRIGGRGREQHRKGHEAGDKGTGDGRAGYGRQEVLTPPPQNFLSMVMPNFS